MQTGGSGDTCWTASLVKTKSSKFSDRVCLQNIRWRTVEANLIMELRPPHATCAYTTHTYTHTCTHTHKITKTDQRTGYRAESE